MSMAADIVVGDPEKALDSIQFLNSQHEVLNADLFGPLSADNVDYVLVVQVHDRIEYLKYLIGSFSRARQIHRVLLVFSHDLNSEPVNQLIQSINFCRVIQVFFPYNIQLFPNIYPGKGPRDCPEGSDRAKAAQLNCVDVHFPDVGGHYRIPKLAQIKHHWWWKINYLFDGIMPKYGLDGKLLLLLEEDHLVAPDFLHTLRLMEEKRAKVCPDCELLALGSYPKTFAHYGDDLPKLGIEIWYSSKYNMGMAIGKQLWGRIRSDNCSKFFCAYDDYNWDWTMMQLSVKCLPTKLRVIYAKAPRVVHIGDCGVHTHRCQADNAVHEALKLFERVNSSFFPAHLEVADVGKRMLKPSKPNGGWADPRDHFLCQLNTHPAADGQQAGQVLAEARTALEAKLQQQNGEITTAAAAAAMAPKEVEKAGGTEVNKTMAL